MDNRPIREVITRVLADMVIATALIILFIFPLLGVASCERVPGPGPTPTPIPTPTPTPTPIPTPSGGDILQGVEWELVSPKPPANFSDQINQTLTKLAGCEPQSRCVVNKPMSVFLAMEVQELRLLGLFAGIQPGADEVCVGTRPSECQGYHVFTCSATCDKGTVGWAPGSARDTWHARTTPDPGPGPGEPALPTAPPPSKFLFDAGIPRPKPANPNVIFWTVTPKVCNPTYCAPNQCCPYAPEGDPNRSALERKYAYPVWEGATPRDDNPFSADSPRGVHVKVCARDAPSVCAEGNAP